MKDAFIIASALVFIISGIWFLIWPQWWVGVIREGPLGEFWTGRIGMTLMRISALTGAVLGVLILTSYLS